MRSAAACDRLTELAINTGKGFCAANSGPRFGCKSGFVFDRSTAASSLRASPALTTILLWTALRGMRIHIHTVRTIRAI